jgi:hypothetical protein
MPSKCALRTRSAARIFRGEPAGRGEGGGESEQRQVRGACARGRRRESRHGLLIKAPARYPLARGESPFATPPPASTGGCRRPFPWAASPSGRRGWLQTASLAPLPTSSRAPSFLSPHRGAIVLTSIFYISSQPLNALTAARRQARARMRARDTRAVLD